MGFFDTWLLWFIQDRFDRKIESERIKLKQENLDSQLKELEDKIKELESIDLYCMSETELRQYGASKGLSEVQQDILVMRIIEHLKISEICDYKHYGRTTIKYHIAEIKKKLVLAQL